MKTELQTIGTDVQFGRPISVTFFTHKPQEIKGGKIRGVNDDGEYLVEAPASVVRLDTSRYGKGFLDGFFRLNEAGDWDPSLNVCGFDRDFIDDYCSLYLPDSFIPWGQGMQHHRHILDEVIERFARYNPRIVQTRYW